MPTFKIWLVGTRKVCIEEADSEREACEKTGWEPGECELQLIPEENIIRDTALRPRRLSEHSESISDSKLELL